jgi:hypothetical protein
VPPRKDHAPENANQQGSHQNTDRDGFGAGL